MVTIDSESRHISISVVNRGRDKQGKFTSGRRQPLRFTCKCVSGEQEPAGGLREPPWPLTHPHRPYPRAPPWPPTNPFRTYPSVPAYHVRSLRVRGRETENERLPSSITLHSQPAVAMAQQGRQIDTRIWIQTHKL